MKYWNYGICQDILKEQCPRGGQIVSEMLAGYTRKTPYKPFQFFGGVDPKKFRRVCMEFSENNWATISETICPEMLILGK